MLRLCGPTAEKPKAVKSPAHAAKNAENGAFLAHLELEILLIEVAYFLAATEYTFSVHCSNSRKFTFLVLLYFQQTIETICLRMIRMHVV